MTDNLIHVDSLVKRFGRYTAVENLNFSIGKGEFFSLLGPSGCGKSTLLRMLGGFERPSSGRIRIDGQDITDLPPYKRPTNMVFQSYAIFPHLTVAENIGYGLRRHTDPKGRQTRVEEAIEMIGLRGFGDRKATELSGGQMQRVSLARALILKPKVLLLDEPLAALDKKLRERMQIELRHLQKSLGITFIFVTHDQEEALTLSDRIAVMSRGQILQIDEPIELYERPSTREVAEFVGEMNFIPATVLETSQNSVTVDAGIFGRVQVDGSNFTPKERVTLALRPERMHMSTGGVPVKTVDTSYFGKHTHLTVAVDGLDAPLTVATPNDGRPMDGQSLKPDFSAAVVLSA